MWVGKEEAQERGCVNSVIAEMAQNPSCGCWKLCQFVWPRSVMPGAPPEVTLTEHMQSFSLLSSLLDKYVGRGISHHPAALNSGSILLGSFDTVLVLCLFQMWLQRAAGDRGRCPSCPTPVQPPHHCHWLGGSLGICVCTSMWLSMHNRK